jgi:hypothetical protein
MPLGLMLTTADAKAWVTKNLARLGAPDQTQFSAKASRRRASQRLIVDRWLERVGARNAYKRTHKRVPDPWACRIRCDQSEPQIHVLAN